MKYLTAEEIPLYCNTIDGVIDNYVEIAEVLIDAYVGYDLSSKTYTDVISINKRGKGKFKRKQINEIINAIGFSITPFGKVETVLNTNDIILEDLGYFIYCGGNHAIFNNPFIQLKITYTSGFVDIPVKLKQATAMIAQNIAQSKSYSGIKSLQDLDVSVAMWDDSFITSDIRMMLQEYRSV